MRLDGGAKTRIRLDQGACDAQADGSDLTGDATPAGVDRDVKLVQLVGFLEDAKQIVLERNRREILFEGPSVDGDLTGAWNEADSCHGGFAATGCVKDFSHGIGKRLGADDSGKRERLRLLSLVRVLRTCVNVQLAIDATTETVVGDHALDRALNEALRMLLADLARRFHLLATNIPGVAGVNFLGLLAAAEADLLGVDHDDEITSIDVRRENRLVLAAKQTGGLDSDVSQDLVLGVDNPPLAFHFLSFG